MADREPSPTPGLDDEAAAHLRRDLVRFLGRRVADAALAEDLAQEALIHVLRGLPGHRGTAALGTWARRIALNVWRDHLRRAAARPASSSVLALLDALGPGAPPGPEAVHDRRATHDCLLEATRRLPLAARRVLLLHDFGEMPLAEAATALGCSPGAAKVRLHRARRLLAALCRADCACERGMDGPLCTPKPRRV